MKGEVRLNDPDAIEKNNREVQYYEVASRWEDANDYKEWQYLLISAMLVMPNPIFIQLTEQYRES